MIVVRLVLMIFEEAYALKHETFLPSAAELQKYDIRPTLKPNDRSCAIQFQYIDEQTFKHNFEGSLPH